MNGVRPAEIAPGVTARSLDMHADAARADRDVSHPAEIVPFHGDDAAQIRSGVNHTPDAAEIP